MYGEKVNRPQESGQEGHEGLGSAGFGFLAGCAPGVDQCFRQALLQSRFAGRSLVECAFRVAPPGLSPAAALRRRTLWLVKRSCLAVLFPADPLSGRWGPGSKRVCRAALEQLKPVFVVSPEAQPRGAETIRALPGGRLLPVWAGWLVGGVAPGWGGRPL